MTERVVVIKFSLRGETIKEIILKQNWLDIDEVVKMREDILNEMVEKKMISESDKYNVSIVTTYIGSLTDVGWL